MKARAFRGTGLLWGLVFALAGGGCAVEEPGGSQAVRVERSRGASSELTAAGQRAVPAARRAPLPPAAKDGTSRSDCLHHGDVNDDGLWSSGDAQLAFFIALGLLTPTPAQSCAADCNGDGVVTADDAQRVFEAALGVGRCPEELPDGQQCLIDDDCGGRHCQNGYCCANGDCCAVAADCPADTYSAPPSCEDEQNCQGTAQAATCTAFVCGSEPVDDDSACGPELVAIPDCGRYPPVTCTGAAVQDPPQCATACDTDDDCNPALPLQCLEGRCQCVPGWTGDGCASCVRYVDLDAVAPAPDGLGWASAFTTVQAGIDAARDAVTGGLAARCEVWVAEGSYAICDTASRTATVQLRPAVDLYGGFAGSETDFAERDLETHVTTLDGANYCYHVVTGSDDATIDGFTVTRGFANAAPPNDRGAGMYNAGASPVVRRCTFATNRAQGSFGGEFLGGAMYNSANAATIVGCAFNTNQASQYRLGQAGGNGGAMYNSAAAVTIVDTTFHNNLASTDYGSGSASGVGGALYNVASVVTLTNTALTRNTASSPGSVLYNDGATVNLVNCTVVGGGALIRNGEAVPTVLRIWNSIVWGPMPISGGLSSTVTVESSDVQGGYEGAGNIDADPGFLDPDAVNYRLTALSPCLDAANGDAAPPADIDGTPRFDQPLVPDTGTGSPPYADMGAYERAVATDCSAPAVFRVDIDAGAADPDGLSWQTAFATVQAGIDAGYAAVVDDGAACEAEVWVADGRYVICDAASRTSTVQLRPRTHVYGGFAGVEQQRDERDWQTYASILDGANQCYHVVTGANRSSLDGVRVYDGNASGGGPDLDRGAGMYNETASAVVRNCEFLGHSANSVGAGIYMGWGTDLELATTEFLANSAAYGGGAVYVSYGTATIDGCDFSLNAVTSLSGGAIYSNNRSPIAVRNSTFFNNSAVTYGGAAYNWGGEPTYTNCLFVGNWLSSGSGGAMASTGEGQPTVSNCTFTANSAPAGGGAHYIEYATVYVYNSILWGDTSSEIRLGANGAVGVAFSDVQGGWSGTNNIDADPLFVNAAAGDLSLQASSPCIDRANGDLAPESDLYGQPRYDDPAHPNLGSGTPPYGDMGAIEFQGPERAHRPGYRPDPG